MPFKFKFDISKEKGGQFTKSTINNISIILKRAIQDVDVSGKFFISD